MITPHRLANFEKFFQRFFDDAILNDLEIMINSDKGLNFVIVNSIFSAINLLGNLYRGERSNHSIETFIRDFFPKQYKSHSTILSDFFRNNLVHVAYTPRGTGVSRQRPDLHLRVQLTPDGYAYILDSDEFYRDFKLALEEYKKRVQNEEPILENFERLLYGIEHDFFEDLKVKFKEDTTQTAVISNATYYPYPQYFVPVDEDQLDIKS